MADVLIKLTDEQEMKFCLPSLFNRIVLLFAYSKEKMNSSLRLSLWSKLSILQLPGYFHQALLPTENKMAVIVLKFKSVH